MSRQLRMYVALGAMHGTSPLESQQKVAQYHAAELTQQLLSMGNGSNRRTQHCTSAHLPGAASAVVVIDA